MKLVSAIFLIGCALTQAESNKSKMVLDRVMEELESGVLATNQKLILSNVDWSKAVRKNDIVRKLKSGGNGGSTEGWSGGNGEPTGGNGGSTGGWNPPTPPPAGGWKPTGPKDCDFIVNAAREVAIEFPGSEVASFNVAEESSSDTITCSGTMCAGDQGISLVVKGNTNSGGNCELDSCILSEWISYVAHNEDYKVFCPSIKDKAHTTCGAQTFSASDFTCNPQVQERGPMSIIDMNDCDPAIITCKTTCE